MKFGGHETFTIREGWLSKAMQLLSSDPDVFVSEYPEDALGVGRNMAKSIRHWMVAAGIANRIGTGRSISGYELAPFGSLVFEHDPHLLFSSSWWMIHINLVNNPDFAASWSWFFNRWNPPRFERAVVVEGLRRSIASQQKRAPSERTLSRDIACLLATYAVDIPAAKADPEDASDCPLRQLGLMRYYRSSGAYIVSSEPKSVTGELLAYAVAKSCQSRLGFETNSTEFSLRQLEQMEGGPGRSFRINAEQIFDLLLEQGDKAGASIVNQAGERIVSLPAATSIQCAESVIATMKDGVYAAA